MITNEMRQGALSKAQEDVVILYTSAETAGVISEAKEKYGIAKNNIAFVNVVGDIILGLYPKSELPNLLVSEVGLTAEIAHRIADELAAFLSPIGGPSVPTAVPDTKERLDLRPQGVEPVVPETPAEPVQQQQGARPLTREELMNALSPKRTMATDIEAVRQKQETESPKESFPGYEAFRKLDEEKK